MRFRPDLFPNLILYSVSSFRSYTKSLKVVIVSTNSDLSGAPIYCSILGRELSKLNHKCFFVFGTPGPVSLKLRSEGFDVFYLNRLTSSFTPFGDICNIILLNRILSSLSPDIVHLNSSKAGFVGRISCFFSGLISVYTVHGWGFGTGKPFLQSIFSFAVEFFLSRFISKYICVSMPDLSIALNALRISPTKLTHIYNGIPDIASPAIDCDQISFDCLMLARVHPSKDHSTLFKAMNLKPFTLALAGNGTNHSDFLSSAKAILEVSNDLVSFLGPRTDVPTLISRARVIVLTSVYESLPICLIEALRAGKPIVATDVGDVSSIVQHGHNGFLCDVGDSSMLSYYISKLINDQKLAHSMGPHRVVFMRTVFLHLL